MTHRFIRSQSRRLQLASHRIARLLMVLGVGSAMVMAMTACSLPDKPSRPALYDFGPGALAPKPTTRIAPLAPLALADIDAAGLLDSTAVLYRLAYDDAHQLRPYSQARWSMSPALLLRQRLRETLGERRTMFSAEEGASQTRVNGIVPRVLRIDLEEFTHYFESPAQSRGVVRFRATLLETTTAGERLVGQRTVIASRPAETADAAGGVRALSAAADAAIEDLSQWLQQAQ